MIMKNSCLYKTFTLLLTLCLILAVMPVYAEDEEANTLVLSDVTNKYMKIGLAFGDNAADVVQLQSENGFLLADCSFDGWGVIEDLTKYKELFVINYYDYGILVVMDVDGEVTLPLYNGRGIMAAGYSLDDMIININGKPYRDGAVFTLTDEGKINVINYVSLEHYVWGILFREVGVVFPIEAIKAQAVASRSFGLVNLNKHSKYGFDLCTTSDCQSYLGVSGEKDICTRACKETEGLVVKYDGQVANTLYFASSGGYTINTEDLWVSPIPYLRAVPDPYSDESKWEVNYSFAKLKEKLEANGYKIGDVTKVEVTNTTSYGAVLDLTFTGTEGFAVVSKSKIKSLLSLKTTFFTVEMPKDEEIQGNVSSGYIYVLDADGEIVKVNTDEISIYDGKTSVSGSELDWTGMAIELKKTDSDTVVFKGAGSGHCIGFSQTGAKNMAKQGFTFDEILKYYYTGVTIEQYECK